MNKLYFSSNSINIYAEDLQYMQDSLVEEAKKILLAITGATLTPVISAGFYAFVTSTGSTTISIDHRTSINGVGGILTSDGTLATTSETYSDIELSDYTLGTINSIYARYYVQDATYDIKNETIIYDAKAIDLNTYQYVYNRQVDLIEIVILTAAEYAALTTTEQGNYILLGRVTAKGPDVALDPVDDSDVEYLKAAIPNGSIELVKLAPNFMLPQTMVDPTDIVDDNYPVLASTSDLQDDLNQIRTVIRHIKSTTSWNEDSVGIKASDPDLNHLFRSGLFVDWENNENIVYGGEVIVGDGIIPESFGCIITTSTGITSGECILTSAPYTSTGQGVIVAPGKILYKNKLVELYSSTGGIGLMVTPPNLYIVGVQYHDTHPTSTPAQDKVNDYGYGTITWPDTTIHIGDTLQIKTSTGDNVRPVSVVTVKYVNSSNNYETLTENLHYTIDYALGTIEIIGWDVSTLDGVVRVFYTWGKKRIDTIVYDTGTVTGGLRIIDGTPEFSYNVVYPPEIPTNCFAIANLQWELAATQLYNRDVVSHYFNMKPHRNVSEITATEINHYDTDGNFRDTFIEAIGKLNMVSVSTGEPLEIGDGYTITSSGYAHIESSTGVYIQSNVFTQADDELYISAFQQTSDYTLSIEAESVAGSGVYDPPVVITVPKNSTITTVPVLLFVAKGSTEGYHKVRITGSVTYKFHKLVFGKLDDYYLKNNFYTEYITTKKIEATNITVTNQITSSVASGTMPLVISSTTNCTDLSVDMVDNRHHGDITPIGSIVAYLPGYFNTAGNNTTNTSYVAVNPTLSSCWRVCDGTICNESESTIFNAAGRYLPYLTDSRFLMGSTLPTTGMAMVGCTQTGGVGTRDSNTLTLTTTELPAHTHSWSGSVSGGAHDSHSLYLLGGSTIGTWGLVAGITDYATFSTIAGGGAHSHSVSGSNVATAAASAFDIRPKYLTITYIIRVK